ncbi:hypothetical protein HYU15_02205 [Candidatus Woesearchaeota archaeon]|nr:hypothetical protein [Candidatus Woesearchaeota archaeon]
MTAPINMDLLLLAVGQKYHPSSLEGLFPEPPQLLPQPFLAVGAACYTDGKSVVVGDGYDKQLLTPPQGVTPDKMTEALTLAKTPILFRLPSHPQDFFIYKTSFHPPIGGEYVALISGNTNFGELRLLSEMPNFEQIIQRLAGAHPGSMLYDVVSYREQIAMPSYQHLGVPPRTYQGLEDTLVLCIKAPERTFFPVFKTYLAETMIRTATRGSIDEMILVWQKLCMSMCFLNGHGQRRQGTGLGAIQLPIPAAYILTAVGTLTRPWRTGLIPADPNYENKCRQTMIDTARRVIPNAELVV